MLTRSPLLSPQEPTSPWPNWGSVSPPPTEVAIAPTWGSFTRATLWARDPTATRTPRAGCPQSTPSDCGAEGSSPGAVPACPAAKTQPLPWLTLTTKISQMTRTVGLLLKYLSMFWVLCTMGLGLFLFLNKEASKTVHSLLNWLCLPALSWGKINQPTSSTQEMKREF